ncbi:MAG TPA: M56 family metallopeptidase [Gemmatimonadaceae bacterium]|nr:M56 family metallopeptidase [Gemmatimonadaceae bacterium]
MTGNIFSTALAWLLTYAIHSTVLLALVWVLVRVRRWSPAATELLWKSAMVGAIVTASAQLALDVRPAGTMMLEREAGSGKREAIGRNAVSGKREATQPGTSQPAVATPPAATRAVGTPAITSQPPLPASRFPLPASAVLVWGLIALALGMGYIGRRLILVGRLGDRREVENGRLLDALNGLAADAGVKRIPRLTSTSRISSPVALGLDEICVPETAITELDLEQQRSLLAHELAHLARRDPMWLIAGSLIERVFWYQPLNRIANRQIAMSAEFLCDDWAVHRTGSGAPLARCLAQVAEWIQASPLGVPVAGMAEERSLLVTRVARLIEGARPTSRSRRGLAVAAVAVLIATILVAPGVSGKTGSVLLADEVQNGASNIKSVDSNTSPQPSAIETSRMPSIAILQSRAMTMKDTGADTGVVSALIARLDDENADVRKAAAQSLGKLKDSRAIPGLIGALKDRDARVRAAAAESLAEFEDTRAIAPLSDLLSDQSTEVKQSALEALSHFDDNLPAAPIVRLLGDPDADVRQSAARLAGKLHDRSVTGALAKLVGDQSADVRQAAIESIGQLGDPTSAVALVPALSDADANVREQALDAIENLKAPIAEQTLIALMHDRDPNVREKAARIAGDRSIVGAVPTLRRMLEDPNPDVRESAVEALGNIPDGAAFDALRTALISSDPKVRRAAAEALGERRP